MNTTSRILPLLLFFQLIAACQGNAGTPADIQPELPNPPAETLTICLGDEPDSLYLYNANENAAKLVLEAIYDGPIDVVNGQPVPVILETLPSFADGSAWSSPVTINPGDIVVNAQGQVTTLLIGEIVFPSGCRDISCAVTYDGENPLEMDQISADFALKPGITWSDGQPLTMVDSVFSYKVASDPATPVDHYFTSRTAVYTALDKLSIQWTGLPGLVTDAFENYFWTPLPAHAWISYSGEELLTLDDVNRSPLGWGPYTINEWAPGEHIELVKNPNYFRASEGLPRFERLIFRITDSNGDTNLANLKFHREPFTHLDYGIGEFEDEITEYGCDLTTTTADMRDQMTVFNFLLNFYQDPAIRVFPTSETDTQFLLFNLDGGESERPQGSQAVRQALSQCIERGRLIQQLSNNVFSFPQLIDVGLPDALDAPLGYLNFDPEIARQAFEAAGWVDHDSSSQTLRRSNSIEGIPDGREFGMTLLVEAGNENENAASMIKTMLAGCGIGLNTRIQPAEVLWNTNEEFSLSRGSYDIALLSWEKPIQNPCLLFDSREIPGNGSLGANFSRFRNQRVDEICAEFAYQVSDSEAEELLAEIQEIINTEIPIVPLYSYPALLTAQKDFCSNGLDATYSNELSGIEEFMISPDCP